MAKIKSKNKLSDKMLGIMIGIALTISAIGVISAVSVSYAHSSGTNNMMDNNMIDSGMMGMMHGMMNDMISGSDMSMTNGHDFTEAKQLIDSGISCEGLTDEQLELIGEYYMEQMHPGEAHEMMDMMMGGEDSESLKQMHIHMARVMYCGESDMMSNCSMMHGMNDMMGSGAMMDNNMMHGMMMNGGEGVMDDSSGMMNCMSMMKNHAQMTQEEIDEMLKSMDKNGDGQCDYCGMSLEACREMMNS